MDRTYRIEKEETGILLGNRRRKNEEKEINESTELLSFRFFSSHFKLPEKLEDRKKKPKIYGTLFTLLGLEINGTYIHT